MKKKLNFWLQIVTICLCICAIAVGVYSVTTASVTAGGKIAFTAHNCKVSVGGYIFGHGLKNGVDDADGTPVDEEHATQLNGGNPITVEGGVSTIAESTLALGTRYFTDMESTDGKPEDIYIVLSVTNTSQKYKISADVDTSDAATKFYGGKIVAEVINDTNKLLDASGAGATAEFIFRLSLQAESDGTYASISGLQDINLKINFSKYEKELELIKYDSTNKYYYIEMGINPFKNDANGNPEPLRWITFAKQQENGTYDFFGKTSQPASGTYYFISEKLLAASNTGNNKGLPLQNKIYDAQYANGYSTFVAGTNYRVSDYALSVPRSYLKGKTVYNSYATENNMIVESGEQVSFSIYNIFESDIYKYYIQSRPLSELYDVSSYMGTGPNGEYYSDLYDCGKERDKLWLLSCKKNTTRGTDGNLSDTSCEVEWILNKYNYGKMYSTVDNGYYNWWLRTPSSMYGHCGNVCDVGGYEWWAQADSKGNFQICPGFQITI